MDTLTDLRRDTKAAAGVLRNLIPDAGTRLAVAEVFSQSIGHAHRHVPACWELTGWPNALRLNVGQVAVLDLSATELSIYSVRRPSLRTYGYRRTGYGNYRAIDAPSECWRVPIAAVRNLAKPLVGRHRAIVKEAATRKRHSPFKNAHSPGFVSALAQLTRRVLPQPDYASSRDPSAEAFEIDSGGFGTSESNREVEQAAIRCVTMLLERDGWEVSSVEREQVGYDLVCRRNHKVRHVEVKGTRGAPTQFIITAGEVRKSEADPKFELFLVGSALQDQPSIEQWSGADFQRVFVLKPIQYVARRGQT